MHKELSKYYDLIYSWKNYKKEAAEIRKLVRKYKRSSGNSLLEVASGTGKHSQYLTQYFKYTGVDLNSSMLKIARKNFPGILLKQGNMINFDLQNKFDVIICLFSSIGYVKTYANLKKTINNFSRHLKKGGVVIIEPWLTKATYKVGAPHLTLYQSGDIKIARASVSEAKNGVSIMEMHHLIAEKGKKVRHLVSREELGMFETSKTLKLMRQAGLDAKFLKPKGFETERGILVGIKK